MALVKPCTTATSPKNTGVECNVSMGPTDALALVPKNAKWTKSDEDDFTDFLQGKIHAPVGQRWFILFGKNAPITSITNAKENDVIETFDNGAQTLIRKGMYTRTFMTNDGGECLAKALSSFDRAGYSFIEFSKNQVKRRVNADGTFSGFPLNLGYAPTPELADFKASYKNAFLLNFSPADYIDRGSIMESDEDLSDTLTGLLDVDLVVGNAGASTTTKLKFQVQTECAETDLVALLGNTLAQITNFEVTKVSDGSAVTITAAAVVSDHIELTGTFTSGTHYKVVLAPAATLLTNGVIGFEGANSLDLSF